MAPSEYDHPGAAADYYSLRGYGKISVADFDGAQDDKAFLLTLTERELARLVAHDLTQDEIARRTGWTSESVSRRLTRISAKLQVHSQLDIATWARTYLATADDVC